MLPTGIQRELEAGVQRTGWTPALHHAAAVLPTILALTPEQFEEYARPIYYGRKDM